MPRKKKTTETPPGGEGPTPPPNPNAGGGRGQGRGRGAAPGRGQGNQTAERPASMRREERGIPGAQASGGVALAASGAPPAAMAQGEGMQASTSGTAEAGRQLGALSLTPGAQRELVAPFEVPESLKGVTIMRRPGVGVVGQRAVVRANYYMAKCNKEYLYQHDVSMINLGRRLKVESTAKAAVSRKLFQVWQSGVWPQTQKW